MPRTSPVPPIRPDSGDATTLRTRSCRSEEHTSELQSLAYLVCRLLLVKKKSKEEAVVLPFLLGAWMYLTPSVTRRPAVRILSTLPLFAAFTIYTLRRLQLGALWPATGP